MTVELLNDEGVVIAAIETGRSGRYRFNNFSETGDYQVRVASSSELQSTNSDTLDALISRGNERKRGLNIGITLLDQLAEDSATSNDRNRRDRQAAIVDSLFGNDEPLV